MTPDGLVVHAAYQFDPREALARAEKPFDELAGYDDAFSNVLEGMEKDPYGPKIKVDNDFVRHLAGNISVLVLEKDASVTEPRQSLIAVQTIDAKALATTIERIMQADPDSSLIEMFGRGVWKIVGEEVENVFVCVELGHLLVTNDETLLRTVLAKNDAAPASGQSSPVGGAVVGDPAKSSPSKKKIDPAEVADLKELVDIYEEIFKNAEALRRGGSEGGELDTLLLAKLHWLNARAKLHEEQQEFSKAIEQYDKALQTSHYYVSAIKEVHNAGEGSVSALLKAQLLRVEAKRALRQAERRLTEQPVPAKADR